MAKKSPLLQRLHLYCRKFGWLFFAPFLFLFCSELIQHQTIFAALSQIKQNLFLFLLAYFVLLLIYQIIYLIFNQLFFATIFLSFLTFTTSLTNYFKTIYRGEPFTLNDLSLWRESLFISSSYNLSFSQTTWLALILLLILNFYIFRFSRQYSLSITSWKKRLFALISLLLLILLSYFAFFSRLRQTLPKLAPNYQFREQTWDSDNRHGFLPTFIIESFSDFISQPNNYSAKSLLQLKKSYSKPSANTTASCSTQIQPDVIVVMNESFINFDKFTALEFAQPLTPTFSQLQKTSPHGDLLVKTYGGGTAETEFEVLTGMSTGFHPLTSITYNRYLKQNVPTALPALFAQAGYQTIAVHPNDPWFFNRDQAYSYLGFQQYQTLTNFSTPLTLRGSDNQEQINNIGFVADSDVTQKIISLSKEESEQAKFIFAVTIQNHGYYQEKVFSDADYQAVRYNFTTQIDPEEFAADLRNLDNYLIGIKDADQMLTDLISFYQKQERPTVLVFFGDHFPGINENFIRRYVTENETELWQAPFVIWKNYQDDNFSSTNHGVISAFQLAPIILETSCQALPPFLEFVKENRSFLPAYNTKFNLLSNGEKVTHQNLSAPLKEIKNQHWLWQYDLLLGKQFSLK